MPSLSAAQVHYIGWKAKFDRWVTRDDLRLEESEPVQQTPKEKQLNGRKNKGGWSRRKGDRKAARVDTTVGTAAAPSTAVFGFVWAECVAGVPKQPVAIPVEVLLKGISSSGGTGCNGQCWGTGSSMDGAEE